MPDLLKKGLFHTSFFAILFLSAIECNSFSSKIFSRVFVFSLVQNTLRFTGFNTYCCTCSLLCMLLLVMFLFRCGVSWCIFLRWCLCCGFSSCWVVGASMWSSQHNSARGTGSIGSRPNKSIGFFKKVFAKSEANKILMSLWSEGHVVPEITIIILNFFIKRLHLVFWKVCLLARRWVQEL